MRSYTQRLLAVALVAIVAVGCSSMDDGLEDPYVPDPSADPGIVTAGSLEEFQAGTLGSQPQNAVKPVLRDINFALDTFELGEAAKAALSGNAEWLKQHPGAQVEIEGHCDERGTIEYNLALGAKRARAVKDYLVALGVRGDRLTTTSYGEELPLCYESDESCWARNRRAHFVVRGG